MMDTQSELQNIHIVAKSESLQKSPIPYKDYDFDLQSTMEIGLPDFMGNEHYKHVKSVKLPNGLEYRQFKHKHSPAHVKKTIHAIYDPKSPWEPLSYLQTENVATEDGVYPHAVSWSEVDTHHRGKGLGRQAYLAALVHGPGHITSDEIVSPEAHRMWKGFKNYPGLTGKISKFGKDQSERHYVKVKDKSQIDHAKMFPYVNTNPNILAASEKNIDPLEKAMHKDDFKVLKEAHNAGSDENPVDYSKQMKAFGTSHPEYDKFLDEKKTTKADHAQGMYNEDPDSDQSNGISAKTIHSLPKGQYMTKPAAEPMEETIGDWVM